MKALRERLAKNSILESEIKMHMILHPIPVFTGGCAQETDNFNSNSKII